MIRTRSVPLAFAFAIAACAAQTSTESQARADTSVAHPAGRAKPDALHVGPIRTAKPADAVIKKELSELQYNVTQKAWTEQPFHNAYWDNHAAGLYVDVVTGEPLFSSTAKFDSGTGWPSFYQPLASGAVVEKHDGTLGVERVEVRSKIGDSHLGHVFDDGPKPTGLRYCINSASLRFIPADKLEATGYAAYKPLFVAKR